MFVTGRSRDGLKKMMEALGIPDGVPVQRIVLDISVKGLTKAYVQLLLDEVPERPKVEEAVKLLHEPDNIEMIVVDELKVDEKGDLSYNPASPYTY